MLEIRSIGTRDMISYAYDKRVVVKMSDAKSNALVLDFLEKWPSQFLKFDVTELQCYFQNENLQNI